MKKGTKQKITWALVGVGLAVVAARIGIATNPEKFEEIVGPLFGEPEEG